MSGEYREDTVGRPVQVDRFEFSNIRKFDRVVLNVLYLIILEDFTIVLNQSTVTMNEKKVTPKGYP